MKKLLRLAVRPKSPSSIRLDRGVLLLAVVSFGFSGVGFAQSGPVASVATPVQFGTIAFGSTLTQDVPVTNSGGGSLTIAPTINGPSYKVVGATPTNCLAGTAAGQTCTLEVEYSPVTVGPHDDNLTLQTNGATSPVVRLKGVASGVGPEMEGPLQFPTIPVGTSVFLPLLINSVEVSAEAAFGTSVSGSSFEVVRNDYNSVYCEGHVYRDQVCDLLVEFKPVAEGLRDDTLTFTPSAGSATEMKLRGNGGPAGTSQPIPEGKIFVFSASDGRVETFNHEGVYQSEFTYLFHQPFGMAVDANNIYVKDGGGYNGSSAGPGCQVDKFDPRGFLILQFGLCTGEGPGNFDDFGSVAVDGDGNLWVTSPTYGYIQKFDASGTFLQILCLGPTAAAAVPNCPAVTPFDVQPTYMAFDSSGDIFLTNSDSDARQSKRFVVKLNSAGSYLMAFGSAGSSAGKINSFVGPYGIAIDAIGQVYVVDTGNNRVLVFNEDGIYVRTIGSYGSGPAEFFNPSDVALDSLGNVYVTDGQNGRVEEFSQTGTYLGQIGSPGYNPGQLSGPRWIAVAQ